MEQNLLHSWDMLGVQGEKQQKPAANDPTTMLGSGDLQPIGHRERLELQQVAASIRGVRVIGARVEVPSAAKNEKPPEIPAAVSQDASGMARFAENLDGLTQKATRRLLPLIDRFLGRSWREDVVYLAGLAQLPKPRFFLFVIALTTTSALAGLVLGLLLS